MHRHGRHVEQNVAGAVHLYKLAAKRDIADAFFTLCEV
jgi:TPR repeat protein